MTISPGRRLFVGSFLSNSKNSPIFLFVVVSIELLKVFAESVSLLGLSAEKEGEVGVYGSAINRLARLIFAGVLAWRYWLGCFVNMNFLNGAIGEFV